MAQADLELRHKDANNALLLVLHECALMTIEIAAENAAHAAAAIVAVNIRDCGKAKLENREIADLAFRLAAQVRPGDDIRARQIKRVLTHLTKADQWEAKLR
ncbi:hypothetical protein IG197_11600 [Aminobacter sp. SR38]|jgi:hypothetical protein|uniref:hypothetical protein n=1 Tax=Aminobacter sp. SR38 TaxID=2774562 RepID=UPI00177F7A0C|nr:hypothetical protein [Aminobacter sp. SR38]QOF73645.1 hypothetical protein IG197_11600 [Aminobacter sp. SR38]